MKTCTDNETERAFKHYYRTSQKPVDTDLALLLSKIVHEKCPVAPHDIGLILEAEVANHQAQQPNLSTQLRKLSKNLGAVASEMTVLGQKYMNCSQGRTKCVIRAEVLSRMCKDLQKWANELEKEGAV